MATCVETDDRPRTLLSWSSGKDSAWALHVLRHQRQIEVVGLLTTVNERDGRVAMHAVRQDLLEAQARTTGLPLWPVSIPSPCTNADYEVAMARVLERALASGITAVAFGDLFLEDIRRYRADRFASAGLTPLLPLWGLSTPDLARDMMRGGLRAQVMCVDPRHLSPQFAGRAFDAAFLDDLPPTVDPCGERGEFHTFTCAGPMFDQPISVRVGEVVERDASSSPICSHTLSHPPEDASQRGQERRPRRYFRRARRVRLLVWWTQKSESPSLLVQ